jgi:regulator of RNase E activity RraA
MEPLGVPAIWVVETVGSRLDHECVLGDGTAKLLHSVGCVGCVTNGRVRDVEGLLTVPFAVYCRGAVVHHCALRITAIDVPVSVGGITVHPGDIVHAWEEGVIRIPPGSAEKLVELAPRHRSVEHQVHAFWRRTDVSLADKRRFAMETYKENGFIRKD